MKPDRHEAIEYGSVDERLQARREFWAVVTLGHGVRDWSRACALYWKAVADDAVE